MHRNENAREAVGAAPGADQASRESKSTGIFPRWNWLLAYEANDEPVEVGQQFGTGTVEDVRLCGNILIRSRCGSAWRSPRELGARWIEYRDGVVAHVFGKREVEGDDE